MSIGTDGNQARAVPACENNEPSGSFGIQIEFKQAAINNFSDRPLAVHQVPHLVGGGLQHVVDEVRVLTFQVTAESTAADNPYQFKPGVEMRFSLRGREVRLMSISNDSRERVTRERCQTLLQQGDFRRKRRQLLA